MDDLVAVSNIRKKQKHKSNIWYIQGDIEKKKKEIKVVSGNIWLLGKYIYFLEKEIKKLNHMGVRR